MTATSRGAACGHSAGRRPHQTVCGADPVEEAGSPFQRGAGERDLQAREEERGGECAGFLLALSFISPTSVLGFSLEQGRESVQQAAGETERGKMEFLGRLDAAVRRVWIVLAVRLGIRKTGKSIPSPPGFQKSDEHWLLSSNSFHTAFPPYRNFFRLR